MTTEEAYIKHICSNCTNTEECEIRTRYDNTIFCKGYKNKTPKKKKNANTLAKLVKRD
ncbi:MAG: hypothetical protein HFJ27_03990 [Clostridia bacterium]|nr:hypothetical protein [Clostridia bacterium]